MIETPVIETPLIEIIAGSALLVFLTLLLTGLVVAARAFLMPSHPVTLSINGQAKIKAQAGQKLLGALTENDILIPSACAGAGTCGLCRVKIAKGGPKALPVEAAQFSNAELRNGMHLACQVVLRNDLTIEVADDLLGAETYMLSVASTRQLTPLIREVVLQMPDGLRMDIHAGSFVQVTAPPFSLSYSNLDIPAQFHDQWQPFRALSVAADGETTRAYSISNRPEDIAAGRIVLNIRLALPPPTLTDVPPGVVSSWLFSLQPGDAIQVSGPYGSFRARDTDREMVFIGGGVGMAPLRAMIFEQLETLGTSRKLSFWYGARSRSDLFYEDEFDALAAKHPNFEWTVAMSDPQPETHWKGATGFVHTVAFENYLRDHPAPESCEYYLCGPPLMIRSVIAMLDDLGVDSDHIFNDDFGV